MERSRKTKLVGLAASFTAAPVMAADLPEYVAPIDEVLTDERILAITGGLVWSNSYEVNPVEGWRVDGIPVDKVGFGGDKLGVLDSEIGGYGQIAVFNYNPANEWDWHAALSGTFLPESKGRRSFDDDDGFRAHSDFWYATLDFDIGKTNKVAPNDYSRLGYGVRGLYASLEGGQAIDKGGESLAKTGEAQYWGIGPYIRGDIAKPLTETFYLVGSADASLLFGSLDRTIKRRETDFDGFVDSVSFSEDDFSLGYTLGGAAGFGYDVTQNFNIEFGYRGEMLGVQEIDDLIFSHGPYITGKIRLGGS